MKMNTNQNTPYRDKVRENMFYDAYKLKSKIETTNFLDNNSNWDKCILQFKYKDNVFGLIEYFKDGSNNSTDYVILENNGFEHKKYDYFYQAEQDMVELMRSI